MNRGRKHKPRRRKPPNTSENSEDGGSGPKRHPPELQGRDIGLFYRDRAIRRKAQDAKRPIGQVLLSQQKKDEIEAILQNTSFVDVSKGHSYVHLRDSSFKSDFLRIINESIEEKLVAKSNEFKRNEIMDERAYKEFVDKQNNPKYVQMMAKRKNLPSFKLHKDVMNLINENQVILISGETGCGKTTQVSQFILDYYITQKMASLCSVICTQPRRISAISVAERVAKERAEALGISVGYQIRLERQLPQDRASICFCTTGVVLKKMEQDPCLKDISHIIIDEIHERDIMTDFLLTLLKQVITIRKDLKIILMSATLNAESFSKYFDNCPHLNIPGFTYPVEQFFLEDVLQRTGYKFEPYNEPYQPKWKARRNQRLNRENPIDDFSGFIEPHIRLLEANKSYSRDVLMQLRNPRSENIDLKLIMSLIENICATEKDQGAILVFLTGFGEISTLSTLLERSGNFPRHKYLIIPLHSQMPTMEQREIFETPPRGVRKIIISTNIAETSITIDDVVFVIDCGRIKIKNFDGETNTETLDRHWVSQANAQQRKGRAGRVQPGVCFHLFNRARYMTFDSYIKPEILRSRLDSVILTAKILQLGKIEPFFARLIDQPDPVSTKVSLNLLRRINALDDDEKLTPLGYHLAKLPMKPQMGKMILFGAMFSCMDPILSIAASLDYKDAFQLPISKQKQQECDQKRRELADNLKSDHLLLHRALIGFENASDRRRFCWEYYLSSQTLNLIKDMKVQLMRYLYELKFVPNIDPKSRECNVNSENISLVKAIICAGLYPNVVLSKGANRKPKFYTPETERLVLNPRSVLSLDRDIGNQLFVYHHKLKTTENYIYDLTPVSPLPVIFFGDNFAETMHNGHTCIQIYNDRLKFNCTTSTCRLVGELRAKLNSFLEYKISHPDVVMWDRKNMETDLLSAIIDLLVTEDEGLDLDYFDDVEEVASTPGPSSSTSDGPIYWL